MNKGFLKVTALMALILAITFVAFPMGNVSAQIADGTYEVNYEMKESSKNNTSISDGYFSKPATLTVKDGVKHIQLTVTSSSMVKSLSAPSGAVDVVSEGDDTRIVKFRVDGDLSQPVNMNMHIVVPDIPEMPGGYDMQHAARAVFDVSQVPAMTSGDGNKEKSDNEENEEATGAAGDNGSGTAEDNPPTGDSTPTALYIMLLLGSAVGIFVVWRSRVARN